MRACEQGACLAPRWGTACASRAQAQGDRGRLASPRAAPLAPVGPGLPCDLERVSPSPSLGLVSMSVRDVLEVHTASQPAPLWAHARGDF